jgi:Tol biopolymer transport system component
VDRTGNERAVATVTGVENWSLAPDERRVAIQRLQNQNVDIWLYDLERLTFSPITFYEGLDLSPIWSPDSTRIAFSSPRQPGHSDLFEKTVGSAESERVLLSGPPSKRPNDWSRDGFLLYEDNPQNRPDLWALPLHGDRKPFPVVQTPSDDSQGQFSPDGDWIAFQSNESGQPEIYAQAFPRTEGKVLISTNGGAQVRWGPKGRELFYIDLDGRLMSVPLEFSGSRRELVPGKAVPLFRTRVGGTVQQGQQGALPSYAVAKDGSRFLMSTLPEEIVNAPIRMILNWRPPAAAGN